MKWLKSVLAGVAGVAFLILSAYRSGANRERERAEAQRMAEHAESQGRRIDVLTKARDIKNEVANADSDELARRVRRWTREGD